MKCSKCKGGGRVTEGFFTITCRECDGKGCLSIDDIWKKRENENFNRNRKSLFDWYNRKINFENA